MNTDPPMSASRTFRCFGITFCRSSTLLTVIPSSARLPSSIRLSLSVRVSEIFAMSVHPPRVRTSCTDARMQRDGAGTQCSRELNTGGYGTSSWMSVPASLRSAVSNPSVN